MLCIVEYTGHLFIVTFFVAVCFFALKQRWGKWLKAQDSDTRFVLMPALAIAFVGGVLVFLVLLGIRYLPHYLEKLGASNAGESWDYMGAVAVLIGAFISLIPVFWLVGQNRLAQKQFSLQQSQNEMVQKQLSLQQSQNNTDIFSKACSLLSEAQAASANSALKKTLARAAIPLLREVACQEEGKYTWAAVMTLRDIPRHLDKKLFSNILNAFEIIAKKLKSLTEISPGDKKDIVKTMLRAAKNWNKKQYKERIKDLIDTLENLNSELKSER